MRSPTVVIAGGSDGTQCSSEEEYEEALNGLCPQGGCPGPRDHQYRDTLCSSRDLGLNHRLALARAPSQYWKCRLRPKAGLWTHYSCSHPKMQFLFFEMIQLNYILETATHSHKPGEAWLRLPLEFCKEGPTSQGLGSKSGETYIQSGIPSHFMETSPCTRAIPEALNSSAPASAKPTPGRRHFVRSSLITLISRFISRVHSIRT